MKKAIVPLGIILLVIFGVFMYLNRFTIFHVSDVDGYVFNTNNIAANLSAGLTENSEKVTFENVKVSDTIYQSGKKYYIGEETKKNVNLDYPIISEDTSSVYVLNDTGNYIDSNFIKETTFKNTILTDGYLYNGQNLERTGEDKYYFLELNNGIYVNLVELNVKRDGGNHIIPINSFIYFEQSFLRYYALENKAYKYYEMPNISDSTKTLVGEDEYKYYDLLINLGVLTPKDEELPEIIEEIELEPEKPPVINTPSTTVPNQGLVGGETPSGGHIVEEEYVKPVVTLEKTKAGVYSYSGSLSIYDPTSRIYKTPTIEYRYKGAVYLRNSFNKSGTIETIGLMPNTTYEVTGYYYYHDEFQQKMKNTFLKTEITTGDIRSLEAFEMSIDGTTPDIKSVIVNGIQLHNNPKDEVLKGLKSGIVQIGQAQLRLNAGDIKNLIALEKIDYKTDKILQSNTTYPSSIQLVDIAGNVTGDIIKIKGNTFEFTTLKAPPSAKISVGLSKNFTQADIKFEISNPDKMTDTRYTYKVFDTFGKELGADAHNGSGVLNEGTQTEVIKNLYAESLYIVKVYADYRNAKGEMVTGAVLASYEFITYDVGRLGAIDFTVNIESVTKEAAVISFQYTNYKETNPVYELIEQDIEIVITDMMSGTSYSQVYDKLSFQQKVTITLSEQTQFYMNTDTVYRIDIIPTIKSADRTYVVDTNLSQREFQTLKNDAEVFISSGFVSLGYVDYDVCVLDADGSIIGENVLVKVVDSEGNVEHVETIKKRTSCTPVEGESTQDVYTRIQAKGLDTDTYSLQIEAPEYNTGHMPNTLKSNYTVRSETVKVEGTTGDLQLNSLINMVNHDVSQYRNAVENYSFDVVDDVNLFDISNNTRWKTAGHQNTSDLKEIRIEDNEVVLSAYKGWRQYSYYMPELKSASFILSFDYEYTVGTASGQKVCISFDDDNELCHKNITSDLSTDSPERLNYKINANEMAEKGISVGEYITFYIWENTTTSQKTTLKLKNVKLELILLADEEPSDYSAFGDRGGQTYETEYAGNFTVSFDDIITNKITVNSDAGRELYFNELEYDYMVRFFLNGEEMSDMAHTLEFDRVNQYTNQFVTSVKDTFVKTEIPADADFEARLSVKTAISDGSEEGGFVRYYDLKVVEFTSEAETRTIKTVEEFLNMHMYGYYLVSEDLNLTEVTSGYGSTFQGSIDFQGHKVTVSQKSGLTSIISRIGGGGTLKNADVHFILNQDTIDEWYYGLVYENYGLISNVKLSVDSSVEPIRTRTYTVQEDGVDAEGNPIKVDKTYSYTEPTGHKYFSLMGEQNFGTVENFAIELNAPIYCMEDCTLGFRANSGTIKNGYITGVNIEAGYTADGNSKDVGVLSVSSGTNSKIENVYSLIDVELGPNISKDEAGNYTNDFVVGNIVASASGAEITNVLLVDPRIVYQTNEKYLYNTTYRNYSKDVSFYSHSSSIIEDIYYVGNFNYSNSVTQEAVISHLSNESFMSARLNSENKFNTVEAWQAGVFPTLVWPTYMPSQPIIDVPKKNESSYLKILSVDSVIQDKDHKDFKAQYKDGYFARVQLSVYNPRNLKIAGLTIEGIGNSKNAGEITVDSQTAGNSDKIGILTIYIKSPNVFKTNYQVTDIYINPSNGNNVMNGNSVSCENGKVTNEIDCSDFPILSLDLYKFVETLADIETAQKEGHLNFRMLKDIDLKGLNNMRLPNITGVLDGDGHTISNVTTENCFVPNLSGTIKNLNIETLTITNGSKNPGYGAFICKSTTGGIVDNVHLSNVDVTAGGADTLYISGLIANAANTKIRNSSVSNFKITSIGAMKGKNAYAGGMVAYGSSTNINNSFVRKINMELNSYVAADPKTNTPETFGVSKYIASGGMVGYASNGVIENVYVTGTINTKFGTVGGIVGETSGYIRSAITKVNIYTIGDNVGGILGNISSDDTNLASKTLVMGDLLTSSDSAVNLDRTSGIQITPNQNFAWNRQSINSIVSANTKMEELLNDEELNNSVVYNSKIGLSEFDFAVGVDNYKKRYNENGELIDEFIMVKQEDGSLKAETVEYGMIPKILHTTTGEILNNQEADQDTIIHYVELFSLLEDPTVTYMKNTSPTDFSLHKPVKNPWDADYVMVSMRLKNENNFELANIFLEDLVYLEGTNIEYSSNEPGVTDVSFRAKAALNKNYDSYKITGIEYFTTDMTGKRVTQTYTQVIKLTIPFYGQIKTAENWQDIKAGTYQNFVLVNDVDLSGVPTNTANINISFNKLVGLDQDEIDPETGEVIGKRAPVIRGITRTGLSSGTGVIDTIVSEIRNVSFDNIKLTATANKSGNYFGVIKFLNGTMKGSWDQATNTYQRMKFTNIHLDGQKISYTGIIAYNKSPDIHYIEYSDVYVKGYQYVGGFIGRSYAVDKTDIIGKNIYIDASYNYVGGLLGYENHYWGKTFTFNTILTGVYVYGRAYVGGAYGYGSGRNVEVYGTTNKYETTGKTYNIVHGTSNYVGGVAGQFSSCYPYYNYAKDLSIKGSYYVGGVCGYRWNCYNSKAINCDVNGDYYVGGVSGWSGYTLLNSSTIGGTVTGTGYVGGLCGGIGSGNLYDCQVSIYNSQMTKVTGKGSSSYNIGGAVGYLSTGAHSIYRNEVAAIITGYHRVGGLIGFVENRNESKTGSRHYVYDNLVANCTVVATNATRAYVGGLIGRVERNFPYNYIYDNVISATIKASTDDMAGYVIGGSEYKYTYTVKDTEGNVVDTVTVDFTEPFGDNFLYQKNDTSLLSYAKRIYVYEDTTLITPSRGADGVKFGTHLADINATEVVIPADYLRSIDLNYLKDWSLYNILSRSVMTRAPVDASKTTGLEYYPYMTRAEGIADYPNPISFNLPGTENVMYSANNTPLYHQLPDFKVYAVDVDKINIEFENVDPYTKLTVNGMTYPVEQTVFTFYYDFKEDFEVTISDKYNEKVSLITADEVKNGVTVIGEYFYYLKDGEVITNNEKITLEEELQEPSLDANKKEEYESNGPVQIPTQNNTEKQPEEENSSSEPVSNENIVAYVTNNLTTLSVGGTVGLRKNLAVSDTEDNTKTVVDNATNIYGNKILLENKDIYNIETGQTYENDFKNLTLTETQSLHEYNYAGQRIETFYYHTLIDGERVDKQVYVKNGQIEIVATEIDNKKNQILVDNYNDKNYLIYLGTDGKLYSIKDDIVFPDGFKNINIKSISTNANANTDMVFVEYNDGSYTVFNYRTGQLIIKQSEENISLEDYIKQYLEISFDNVTATRNPEYAEAKKLVEKLNTRPLSSFHMGENTEGVGTLTSSKYSIVYNPSTGKYDVYELPGETDSSINSLTKSLDKSVDSIIDADPLMIEYYREAEGKRVTIISAILIVLGIVLGITGAVLILGKNVKKEKKISDKRKEVKA